MKLATSLVLVAFALPVFCQNATTPQPATVQPPKLTVSLKPRPPRPTGVIIPKPTSYSKVEEIVQKILVKLPGLKDLELIQLTDEQFLLLLSHFVPELKEHLLTKCPEEDLLAFQMHLLKMLPLRIIYGEKFCDLMYSALNAMELKLKDYYKYLIVNGVKRHVSTVVSIGNGYKEFVELRTAISHHRMVTYKLSRAFRSAVYYRKTVEDALRLLVSAAMKVQSKQRRCIDVKAIKAALAAKAAEIEKKLAQGIDFARLDERLKWIIKDSQMRQKILDAIKNVGGQLEAELKKLVVKIKGEIETKFEAIAPKIHEYIGEEIFLAIERIVNSYFPERKLLHFLQPDKQYLDHVLQALKGMRSSRERMRILPKIFSGLGQFLESVGHSEEDVKKVLVALVLRGIGIEIPLPKPSTTKAIPKTKRQLNMLRELIRGMHRH